MVKMMYRTNGPYGPFSNISFTFETNSSYGLDGVDDDDCCRCVEVLLLLVAVSVVLVVVVVAADDVPIASANKLLPFALQSKYD